MGCGMECECGRAAVVVRAKGKVSVTVALFGDA